ncbi:hypothetical protein [Scytonema sp. UIC 10036]|uniref:hypothetical protein n=1 Tax=Scytonema sp. UIC 10036 TaxID=2304196 RepID=UPI001A9BEE15|nr:hypothetical protein [Scytonema sp. UIC 10036]
MQALQPARDALAEVGGQPGAPPTRLIRTGYLLIQTGGVRSGWGEVGGSLVWLGWRLCNLSEDRTDAGKRQLSQ